MSIRQGNSPRSRITQRIWPASRCGPQSHRGGTEEANQAAAPAPRAATQPPPAECGQQFPPSYGDCHTPLPREVRKEKNTTPRACCPNSAATRRGRGARRAQTERRPVREFGLISRDLFSAALLHFLSDRAAAPITV